jgi:hypothetical protein
MERELVSEVKEGAECIRGGGLVSPENARDAADLLFAVRKLLELGCLRSRSLL